MRAHLRSYSGFLGRGPILGHIDTYCRGLLSGGGKGDRNLLCAAPFGPFRQKVPVPFSVPKAGRVHISVKGQCHDRAYWLIVAKNTATGETKYFISNAPLRTSLRRMLEAAFSRWGIEHLFRVAKTEIGLGHYEGRRYLGLMRHMMLCQLTLLFVAEQTERLRGEKPAVDQGAGGPGAQRRVPAMDAA